MRLRHGRVLFRGHGALDAAVDCNACVGPAWRPCLCLLLSPAEGGLLPCPQSYDYARPGQSRDGGMIGHFTQGKAAVPKHAGGTVAEPNCEPRWMKFAKTVQMSPTPAPQWCGARPRPLAVRPQSALAWTLSCEIGSRAGKSGLVLLCIDLHQCARSMSVSLPLAQLRGHWGPSLPPLCPLAAASILRRAT